MAAAPPVALCNDIVMTGRQPSAADRHALSLYPMLTKSVMCQLWSPVAEQTGDYTHSATLRVPVSGVVEADLHHIYEWCRHGGNLSAVRDSRSTSQAVARGRRGFATGLATNIGHNAVWAMKAYRRLIQHMDAGPDGLLQIFRHDVEMPLVEGIGGRTRWQYMCPVAACVWLVLRAHVRGIGLSLRPGCSAVVQQVMAGNSYRDMPSDSQNCSALNVGGAWRCPRRSGMGVAAKAMAAIVDKLHGWMCPTNVAHSWYGPPVTQHVVGVQGSGDTLLTAPQLARALVGPAVANGALYIEKIQELNGVNWRALPADQLVYPMPITLLMDGKQTDQVRRNSVSPVLATCSWLPGVDTARSNLRINAIPVAYLMLPAGQYDTEGTGETCAKAIQPQLQVLFDAIASLRLGPTQHIFLNAQNGQQPQIIKFKPYLFTTMADLRQQAMNSFLRQNACSTCVCTATRQQAHTAPIATSIRADLRVIVVSAIAQAWQDVQAQPAPLPTNGQLLTHAQSIGGEPLRRLVEGTLVSIARAHTQGLIVIQPNQFVPAILAQAVALPPTPCAMLPAVYAHTAWNACDGCMWQELASKIHAWPIERPDTADVDSVYHLDVAGFRCALRTGRGRHPAGSNAAIHHGYITPPAGQPAQQAAVEVSHVLNDDLVQQLFGLTSDSGSDSSGSYASTISGHSAYSSSTVDLSESVFSDSDDVPAQAIILEAEVPYTPLMQTTAHDSLAEGARPSERWPTGTLRPTDALHELGMGPSIVNYFKVRQLVAATAEKSMDYRVLNCTTKVSDNGIMHGFSRTRVTQRKNHKSLSHAKASERVALSMYTPVLLEDRLPDTAYVVSTAISDISTQVWVMLKHSSTANLQQLTLLAERINFNATLGVLGAPANFAKAIKAHSPSHIVLFKLMLGVEDHGNMGGDEASHSRWASIVNKLATFGHQGGKNDGDLLLHARELSIASSRLARILSVQRVRSVAAFHPNPVVERHQIVAAGVAAVTAFVAASMDAQRSSEALSICRSAASATLAGMPTAHRQFIMQQYILPLRSRIIRRSVNSVAQAWTEAESAEHALKSLQAAVSACIGDWELQPLPALTDAAADGDVVAPFWQQPYSPVFPGVEAEGWAEALWVQKDTLDLLMLPDAQVLIAAAPEITVGQVMHNVHGVIDGDILACQFNFCIKVQQRLRRCSAALQGKNWRRLPVAMREDLMVLLQTGGVFPNDQQAAVVLGFVRVEWSDLLSDAGKWDTFLIVRRFAWAGPQLHQGQSSRAGSRWWHLQLSAHTAASTITLPAVYSLCSVGRVLRTAVAVPDFSMFDDYHVLSDREEVIAVPPLSIIEQVYAHPILATPLAVWVLACMPPAGGVVGHRHQPPTRYLPLYCED